MTDQAKARKLAIIDHVGTKAGMDYYSMSLLRALESIGADVRLYSNFRVSCESEKVSKTFFMGPRVRAFSLASMLIGFILSMLMCCYERRKIIMAHVFSFSIAEVTVLGLLWIFRFRIFAFIHDPEPLEGKPSAKWAVRLAIFFLERCLVHNRYSKEVLAKFTSKDCQNLIVVVPHGNFVDLNKTGISKSAARQRLNLESDATYLLFFGQIKESKGLDVLIKALAQVNRTSVRLIVAGRPWRTDFKRYDELINCLGQDERVIKIIRFISDEERDLLFRACDLLVIPYRKIFQSGVLIMGLSYSIPIVASDLPANREFYESCECFELFPDGDDSALSELILRMTDDTDYCNQLSQRGLIQIKDRNSWQAVALKVWSLV